MEVLVNCSPESIFLAGSERCGQTASRAGMVPDYRSVVLIYRGDISNISYYMYIVDHIPDADIKTINKSYYQKIWVLVYHI